jgi:hypothetical protein
VKHYHTEQCAPTEAGLYWWKKFSSWKEWKPVVLYIEKKYNPKNKLYLNGWPLHYQDGEFIGPLPLPHGVQVNRQGLFMETPPTPTEEAGE